MRAVCLTVALGIGLAGSDAGAADGSRTVTVEMRQQTFVPATLDVTPGTTIEWINKDSMPHSATSDGRFDSGPILPGKTFHWTAQGNGRIDYRCIFHPSMTATLEVK
jgi:plastocyanin